MLSPLPLQHTVTMRQTPLEEKDRNVTATAKTMLSSRLADEDVNTVNPTTLAVIGSLSK